MTNTWISPSAHNYALIGSIVADRTPNRSFNCRAALVPTRFSCNLTNMWTKAANAIVAITRIASAIGTNSRRSGSS